jgi:hypothetical protein
MQIIIRCGKCQKVTVSESDADTCLEIDFCKKTIEYVCRHCKKQSVMELNSKTKAVSQQPIPRPAFV